MEKLIRIQIDGWFLSRHNIKMSRWKPTIELYPYELLLCFSFATKIKKGY